MRKKRKPTKLQSRQRIEKQILVNANRQSILVNELSGTRRMAERLWSLLAKYRKEENLCVNCGEDHAFCSYRFIRGKYVP